MKAGARLASRCRCACCAARSLAYFWPRPPPPHQDFSQRGFLETTACSSRNPPPTIARTRVGEPVSLRGLLQARRACASPAPSTRAPTRTARRSATSALLVGPRARAVRPCGPPPSATYTRGKLTVEAGKQFIRWGKTDVLNPTDRFAPRDFVNVVDNDYSRHHRRARHLRHAVRHHRPGLRAAPDAQPRAAAESAMGGAAPGHSDVEGPRLPRRPAVRRALEPHRRAWPSTRSPSTTATTTCRSSGAAELGPARADVQRYYPQMRMYGADAAVPLPPVTLKGEAPTSPPRHRNRTD